MDDDIDPRDELASALTHGLGAVAALAGGSVLITLAALYGDGWQLGASIVFGVSLLLLSERALSKRTKSQGGAERYQSFHGIS